MNTMSGQQQQPYHPQHLPRDPLTPDQRAAVSRRTATLPWSREGFFLTEAVQELSAGRVLVTIQYGISLGTEEDWKHTISMQLDLRGQQI